jgi:hypothetical protein
MLPFVHASHDGIGAAASGGAGGTAALEAELSEYDATLVERLSTFEASHPRDWTSTSL